MIPASISLKAASSFSLSKGGRPKRFPLARADSIPSLVRSAINLREANGAEIVKLSMPWVRKGRPINFGIILPEAVSIHEKMIGEHADLYTPAVRARIQSGFNVAAVDYVRAQRARQWFNHQMAESMSNVDVLITPTVPIQAPTIADCTPSSGNPGAGSELAMFTGVFDVTGQPSHSIPCGFRRNADWHDDNGPPVR